MKMKIERLRVMLMVTVFTVVGVLFGTGCKPAECRKMVRCCEEIKDVEGVGAACGPMATGTKNEATCTSVLQTVGYMLEDRQLPVPDVCR